MPRAPQLVSLGHRRPGSCICMEGEGPGPLESPSKGSDGDRDSRATQPLHKGVFTAAGSCWQTGPGTLLVFVAGPHAPLADSGLNPARSPPRRHGRPRSAPQRATSCSSCSGLGTGTAHARAPLPRPTCCTGPAPPEPASPGYQAAARIELPGGFLPGFLLPACPCGARVWMPRLVP